MFGRGIFCELKYVATEFTDACRVYINGPPMKTIYNVIK